MSLAAIFYARFHPERGPCVIEQYPAGSIATRSTKHEQTNGEDRKSSATSLVDFSEISSYIIPPYELCGKSLSICCHGREGEHAGRGRYRVLGWPISLESEEYARNRFTFNVCFVLREHEKNDESGGVGSSKGFGVRSWEKAVKKTALFFQALEVEDGTLAAEEEREDTSDSKEGRRVIGPLLEKLFEQLTSYGEACVRISNTHVLNLRLEAQKPSAPKVRAWDVPLLIRSLPNPKDWSWDLTLARIHPHIDGVNHVSKIADKADVELKLVKRAIRGLLYHGRVRMLDIFHFQAIYALTPDFTWFVQHEEMQEECRRYVSATTSAATNGSASTTDQKPPPTGTHILNLYTTLTHPPQPLHTSLLANDHLLTNTNIDIRRLITYGILKGFLRRVHKYALLVAAPSGSTSQVKLSGSGSGLANSGSKDAAREFERAWRKAALSSGWATPPFEVGSLGVENAEEESGTPSPEKKGKGSLIGAEKDDREGDEHGGGKVNEVDEEEEKLRGFLDGKHCLDEICVAMRMSERKLLDKLRSGRLGGEVVVFCK